jgi:hypothetical protein
VSGIPPMGLLPPERGRRLRGHIGPPGPSRRRDRRDDEPLHQRRRAQQHPVARVRVVEQVEGQLRGEHGAAEVHQHDDARPGVGRADCLRDGDGVGAERGLVEPRGHLDSEVPRRHLPRQCHSGVAEHATVRDDDQPDKRAHPPPPFCSRVALLRLNPLLGSHRCGEARRRLAGEGTATLLR